MLHAWKKFGANGADAVYLQKYAPPGPQAPYPQIVGGKLSYIRQVRGVDDRIFRRLYSWAKELDSKNFPELPEISARPQDLATATREFPAITGSDKTVLRKHYFERMVKSCKGDTWLIDPDLDIDILSIFLAAIDLNSVRKARLLTRGFRDAKTQSTYQALTTKYGALGLEIEWRSSHERKFHDRLLIDSSYCVNFGGPFKSILDPDGPYGQNSLTFRPPELNHWWNISQPIQVLTKRKTNGP
jgi:hypothetical protein